MASPWAVKFDDDEEAGAAGGDFGNNTKDALLFLIDARAGMFEKNESGEVYINNAMSAVVELLKTKIIASAKDLVGVWFYGTKERNNDNSFAHVYQFIELGPPSATGVKRAESVLAGTFDFAGEIGSLPDGGPTPLHHALWACSMSLAAKAKEGDSQRIWLFTNDDDPNPGDKTLREQCVQKARDLADIGQDITLWYMSRPDREFDVRKFFADTIPVDEEDDESGLKDVSNLADVISCVRKKEYRKRAYARIPLKIAEGVELAVGVYNLIYPAKKPYAVQLETATNQQVKVETNWMCADTGKELLPNEIKTYHKFATSQVFFDKADMKEIKNFGKPSLRLMGFKPKSVLADYLNMRSPYFLYPHEDGVTGSTVAFRALQEKMIELEKVAIVRMIMRDGSAPRFCALLAQKEVRDDEGWVDTPTGMFMIPLPYSDDIRELHVPPAPKPEPEQVAAAKKVVQCINAPGFSSYDFDNPVLQKHYAAVQALALTEDQADWDEKDDLLVPDLEGMAKYADVVASFRDSFGGGSAAASAASGAKRRRPAAKKKAPARRRGAAAGDDGDESKRPTKKARGAGAGAAAGGDDDVPAMAKAGTLKKLKVGELKAWMKANGLKTSGRKADLIEAIEEHLGV